MRIRWITSLLGTAPAEEVRGLPGLYIVDVRDLVDKSGNRPEAVRDKIMDGVRHLQAGGKIVVACDYGISRSNAVAAGILAVFDKIPFYAAVRRVMEATGEYEIKSDPLNAVRQAIETDADRPQSKGTRTILVTGARGTIGVAACRRLAERFAVVAPARDELDIELGSTQLALWVAEHKVDCIVHLANPRVYTSNVALGKTLTMLRNVLDVCVSQDINLVYPSSWETYSGYAGVMQVDEAVPAFPRGPYGETKYLTELLIQHWQRTTSLRCSILRSSPVYGPGSPQPKFIYNFIEKAKCAETIVTHQYRNGEPALDLLFIDDLVDVLVRAVEKKHEGAVNIGTGVATSTRVVAEMLRKIIGGSSRIEQTLIDANAASIAMNTAKARKALGWKPTVTLEEGLTRLLADYQEKRGPQ